MCFDIDYSNPKPRRALRRITCYKVVKPTHHRDMFYSLIWNYIYTARKRPPSIKLLIIGWHGRCIEKGYHSFSTLDRALQHCKEYSESVVVKCVIPFGSKYYYNSFDLEYVSSSIIVKEVIFNPQKNGLIK